MRETTLADLGQQYQALETDAEALLAGLSEAQLAWQPERARWSVAHCLHHLNIADLGYQASFDRALAKLRARGSHGDGTVRLGFLEAKFAGMLEPPPSRPVSAPKRFHPALERPPEEVVAEFRAVRKRFRALLDAGDGLDLNRLRVRSPVSPLIRFRLGSAFVIAAAHDRRHLWQARQVREHASFPGS